VSESEIHYCVKEGASAKIESAKFTKATKENPMVVMEGKGNNIFIFDKHEDFIFILDESQLLKKLEYDHTKRKYKQLSN